MARITFAPANAHIQHRQHTTTRTQGAVVFIGIAAFTAKLGHWQVLRRDWKQGLIDERLAMLSGEAVDLIQLLNSPALADSKYQQVTVTGVLDYSREILVGPRSGG